MSAITIQYKQHSYNVQCDSRECPLNEANLKSTRLKLILRVQKPLLVVLYAYCLLVLHKYTFTLCLRARWMMNGTESSWLHMQKMHISSDSEIVHWKTRATFCSRFMQTAKWKEREREKKRIVEHTQRDNPLELGLARNSFCVVVRV